jgi:purine-binding chemotaxis protein CheW
MDEGMVTPAEQQLLLCRVGSHVCGIRLEHVIETFRPLPTEPLAGTPSFVVGMSVVRDVVVPIVNVATLLGATSVEQTFARFIAIRAGRRVVVLATGPIVGVRVLPTSVADALPPLFEQDSAPYLEAVSALDAELLVVLQASRIVPDAVWDALDSVGVS